MDRTECPGQDVNRNRRPRRWYRNRRFNRLFQLAAAALFLLCIFTFGVLFFVLPKPTVSEREKRELSPLPAFSVPSVLSGEYMKDMELYVSDTFPFREEFVAFSGSLENLRGFRPDDVRIVDPSSGSDGDSAANGETGPATAAEPPPGTSAAGTSAAAGGSSAAGTGGSGAEDGSSAAQTSAAQTSAAQTSAASEPEFELERSGPVFIYGDMAFEIFGGSEKQAAHYAGVINEYKEKLGDGVKVYSMIIPTSIAFHLPDKYKSSSTPEKPNIDGLYAALSPDVVAVDAYSALEAHRSEYIYFRTDHHWTGLGAYYAYTAFAKAAGFTPLAYDSYDKGRIDGFLGSLYSSTQDVKLKENPDYVEYCRVPVETEAYLYKKDEPDSPVKVDPLAEFAKGANAYSVYLHGDYPRIDIRNLDSESGKSILVVKESYGNALVPYLIPHYENVYVLDLRYYKGNVVDFVRAKGIGEVLIADNIFAANTKSFADHLEKMLNQ